MTYTRILKHPCIMDTYWPACYTMNELHLCITNTLNIRWINSFTASIHLCVSSTWTSYWNVSPIQTSYHARHTSNTLKFLGWLVCCIWPRKLNVLSCQICNKYYYLSNRPAGWLFSYGNFIGYGKEEVACSQVS